ncbi:MAG: citrate lyase acyl carrier protein [Spirochaetia bacterium]|nr:citrate lyase acyl carrier protein [Spirochaetia bacterium]
MSIQKAVTAGSLESSDVLVTIAPAEGNENEVKVESIVIKQFGNRIRKVADEVIAASGLKGAIIHIQDRGALECTLRARLETAISRALAQE